MGKTALATCIGYNAARFFAKDDSEHTVGCPVLIFSLEMSAGQLVTRLLAQETGIASDQIRCGKLKKEDFTKFVNTQAEIGTTPLFIDDTPALSLSAIRTRARRMKRQHNIGMVIIDYLQLIGGVGGRAPSENRVQELSAITRGLKQLAKEIEAPVVALSQLSRMVEQREDKRPQLSDLRESGSIEQDADVVMFVYREEYYLSRSEPKMLPDNNKGQGGSNIPMQPDKMAQKYEQWKYRIEQLRNTAEVIISKQRHGSTGSVELYFDAAFTKFGNLNREQSSD